MSNYAARPYCKAIFALARRDNNFSIWQAALDKIALHQPEAAIKIWPPVANLLNLLIHNNQLDLLPHLAANFKQLVADYNNIIEARVVTAVALNDAQKDALKLALAKRYSTSPQALHQDKRSPPISLTYELDSAIIGGVVIHLKDQVIDGSIKTALHCLKQSLE